VLLANKPDEWDNNYTFNWLPLWWNRRHKDEKHPVNFQATCGERYPTKG